MTTGDYALVRLNAVNVAEQDITTAATHQDKFVNFYQQTELDAYIKHLDAKATIERRLSNADVIQ